MLSSRFEGVAVLDLEGLAGEGASRNRLCWFWVTRAVRAFVPLVAILLIGCQRPAPIPATSYEELRRELPIELRAKKREVLASENGWTLALPSKEAFRATGDWSRLVGTDLSAPADHAEAHAALQHLAPILDRLKAALARPRWQAPARNGDIDFRDLATFKTLAKALQLRAEVSLKDGRPQAAIEDLILIRRLSDRMFEAGENVIGYVVAATVRQIGNRALAEFATDPHVGRATLDAALAEVNEGRATDPHFARALGGEAATFVSGIAKMHGPVESDSKTPADLILRDHPNRLDLRGTVRLYGEALKEEIANARRLWADQRAGTRRADLLRDWPKNVDDETSPPTPSEIATARHDLHGVPNALGRKIVADTLGAYEGLPRLSFTVRASDSATRTVLLLAREAKGGETMRDVPRDPFSEGAMRFDVKRNIVWSVGPNGKNDGGVGQPYRQNEPDLVWPLRAPKRSAPRLASPP